MHSRWLLIIFTVFVVFAYSCWRKSVPSRPLPVAEEDVSVAPEPPPPAPAPPPPPPEAPKPPPPPMKKPAPEPVQTPPKQSKFDPKSARKLDMALPKSVKELLENRTPYIVPRLPREEGGPANQVDRAAEGYFCGYIYLNDGTTRRLRLQRSFGEVKLAVEEQENTIKEWRQSGRTLRVSNFKGDPYGLVLEALNGPLIYLKFKPDVIPPGYIRPLDALAGWYLSDQSTNPSVSKVALVDVNAHNREFPPGSRDAEEWPKREAVKALNLAESLPAGFEEAGQPQSR